MKRAILVLLASATLANAGLTGTQMKQVITFADNCGFVYMGPKDINLVGDDRPFIQKVMVFYLEIANGFLSMPDL
jgi:hypothetical protein